MKFLISESFSGALAKLNVQEQKAVKITVFDLQQNPGAPGLQFHRIANTKDKNFWSMRVSRDVRLIVHKTQDSLLVCYVDHHDDAYAWAKRRRIEKHPKTGAVQIVEIRELVQEMVAPVQIERDGISPELLKPTSPEQLPLIFAKLETEQLLEIGVPEDWLKDILLANENNFLDLADHLPAEAAEALLEYVDTGRLVVPQPILVADGFAHPDAQRRFRVLENVEELTLALDYPWEKWTIFLHPSQQKVVDQDFNGPARVSGSAGTGKTVVALHRAARIIKEQPDAKILLTTFSEPLSNALEHKLLLLMGETSPTNTSVRSFQAIAKELFVLAEGHDAHPANREMVQDAISKARGDLGLDQFTERFLYSEWRNVVDAWQLLSVDEYCEITRIGRRNRLGSKQRERIWPIFEHVRTSLRKQNRNTWPEIFGKVTSHFATKDFKPFTHIIVDEAQDLGVPELRMLAAIARNKQDALFFAGDLGQRIFQEPFSWMALGIDVRGRSKTLKVNYRTSHQIRATADRLLPDIVRDADGNEEDRSGTVSVFNGPKPKVYIANDIQEELNFVASKITEAIADGISTEEIGIFVRSPKELGRARSVGMEIGEKVLELSERVESRDERLSIGTMHLAKGLEYKMVVVMACDEDVLPNADRIESVADESELDEVQETELRLFYVACTRARERLIISGVGPASEFLYDLK